MAQWYKVVLLYLWIAPHIILAALAALMLSRRRYLSFPFFFAYAIYETVTFLIRFGVYMAGSGPAGTYRSIFIVTLAGSVALRFGIIQEIFDHAFQAYPHLGGVVKTLMRWLTGLLVAAAILTAVYSSGSAPENLMKGVALVDRCVAIVQAGLLLFVFLISRSFGLSLRSFSFGIALGFGIMASTELAVSAMHLTKLSVRALDVLDLLRTGSYHVSVLAWLGYLLAVEKSANVAEVPVAEIERWSEELERFS